MMKTRFLLAALLFTVLLAACSPAQPAPVVTLKAAVLPILDVLPMVVAQQEGLFAKNNVNVELIPVGSAPERDQLISAAQADLMVNELASVMFLNQERIQVQAVRFARAATTEQALFRILAAKDSGIQSPADLKGVPVGVSQATVIEYLTERLLQAEGLSPAEIETVAIPKIPDRMALLASGELKAAMLPEPFSSLAAQQGAVPLLDDTLRPDYSFSVITFRKAVIDENPQAVRGFLAAIEEAVELINADPQKYSALMVDQKMVPAPLAESFKVPTYPLKGVPSQAQFDDALAWVREKGYLDKELAYADCVNSSLLP
ncbi:MAG: ABC transporter substrate-binding protein [Chloroflexota bacterium]